jgi:transaldolase
MAMLRSRHYVEQLIGPHTVIALADHGTVRAVTLTEARDEAAAVRDALAHFGVGMESVAEKLEAAGVQLFEQSFAQLLDELEVKVGALRVGTRT